MIFNTLDFVTTLSDFFYEYKLVKTFFFHFGVIKRFKWTKYA